METADGCSISLASLFMSILDNKPLHLFFSCLLYIHIYTSDNWSYDSTSSWSYDLLSDMRVARNSPIYLGLLSLSVFWIGTINWPLNSLFGLVDLFRSHRLHKQICAEPELIT